MNKNSFSRFAVNPTNINIQRSIFGRESQHKTTFDSGKLIPIYCDEVLPGDTWKLTLSLAVRMTTPIFPVMDNANLDIYAFFIPNRLVWDHWKEFNGENNSTYWDETTEYQVPIVDFDINIQSGEVGDYYGLPINTDLPGINALPGRGYAMIWNEWFRDQNTQQPLQVNTGDEEETRSDYSGDNSAFVYGQLACVNKYHDYFTSALPAPQKGPAVELPLASEAPVSLKTTNGSNFTNGINFEITYTGNATSNVGPTGTAHPLSSSGAWSGTSQPAQLYADLSNATAATINQLRQAFAIQALYEKDSRGGTRYIEVIRSHFGITSPDARQQRPEFLGGKRVPININQVLQTSSSDTTSPQGNTAAYSLTNDVDNILTYSATEHGYIHIFACVRTEHTYQQGVNRMFLRKNRFDFYWPSLANIGEQGIKNAEIYAQGTAADDKIFGYQEAWADYRYKPSIVSGKFRSAATGSLDTWHYADNFEGLPVLNSSFMKETSVNIQRTLAVQDEPQFIGDFYFKGVVARPMPVYSIPATLGRM